MDDIEEDYLMLLMVKLLTKKKMVHTRYKKIFLRALTPEARKKRSGYIPRQSLHDPFMSGFSKLYWRMDDSALIQVTGFDHSSFLILLEEFSHYYDNYTCHSSDGSIRLKDKRGRKKLFDATFALALVLMWTRSRGSSTQFQIICGGTKSTINLYLRFGKRIFFNH